MRILLARIRDIAIFCTIGRPVILTDLLELPDTVKCRVFGWLGVHEGLAEWCPGWCPCGGDLDAELAELAEAGELPAAA